MSQNELQRTEERQNEIRKQVLVASVVDELNASTTGNQRGLLRILAIAKIHDLDCGSFADSFSYATKGSFSSAAAQVGDLLDADESLIDAFEHSPRSLPRPAIQALRVASQHDVLDRVYQRLLASNVSAPQNTDQANDVRAMDMLSRLAGKTAFVVSITSFIMLFIVPQFKAMFEEFGIELPASMILAIVISNRFTQLWFLVPMVLAVLFFTMAIRSPQFLSRYFLRWIPSQWSDPTFSKAIKKKMKFAWNVYDQSDPSKTELVKGNSLDRKTEAAGWRESRVVEVASSPESSSWILRKMASKSHSSSQKNWYLGLRVFSIIVSGFLFLFSFILAVALFQSLISIIQGI